MRKQILAVLLFVSSFGFQSVNEVIKQIIIPLKYEFRYR
jgi:hypothetical protein